MNTYLSIDVGTSSTKLSLFDWQGKLVAARSAAYPVEFPQAEYAEQETQAWWQVICQCAPEIVQAAPGRIAAIAVSGQTPLCVPIDEDGRPLRKAILWLDRRATAQVGWLQEHIGEDRCQAVSLNRLDSYFGGVKWLWLRQAEPDIFARTWKILQASSYIIYKLSGRAVIDPSQAGLCSPCFNFEQQAWDAELCQAMGLPTECLPEIQPSTAVVGTVTHTAAQLSGLPEGTPIVCGGGDFACAGFGAGLVGKNSAALMLGTAGNLLFPGAHSRDPRLLHTMHVTGEPLPFGGVMAGGNLSWFAGLLGSSDPALFAHLDEEAAVLPPGSVGLIFLPYLMGERTPIWDPAARGAFIGLSSRHTRGHLYRAVLEGVAFAFRQIAEIAWAGSPGAGFEQITAIDGGARSPLWRQILADVLEVPVAEGSPAGGTALGSAYLAALGVGAVPSFQDVAHWAPQRSANQPDPTACRRYETIYPVYAGLYAKLKPDFDQLSAV